MDKTNTVYLEYALGDYPAVSHYMRALRERHFNVMTEPKLDTPYILVIMFSAQYVLANATFGSADPHRRPSRPPERIVVVRLDATRLPPYLSIHDTIFAANMTSFMSFDAIIDTLAKVLRSESISEDGFDTGAPNTASTVESAPTTPTKSGVFISHHHSDDEDAFTSRLQGDLEAAGADVWVDYEQILSNDFIDKLNEGLAGRRWLVLVMTPASLNSNWLHWEVKRSHQ
jgi:hypothetical protein